MRIGLLLCLFLLMFLPTARATDSVPSDLRAVIAERQKASLEGDSSKASSLMADEYIQTDISGHVQDKATWFKEYFDPVAALIKAGKPL